MRNFSIATLMAALILAFAGWSPAEAKTPKRHRKNAHRTRYGSVYYPAYAVRAPAKSRSSSKAGASTRGRSSSWKRSFKTYSYRISPSSSSSFSGGPSSSGAGRYSTSEFMVWPNGR